MFKLPAEYDRQKDLPFFSIINSRIIDYNYNFEIFDAKFIVVPGDIEVIKIQVKNKNKILSRFQDFLQFKFNSIKTAQAQISNFLGYLYNDAFYINRNYSGTMDILNFLEYEKDNMRSSDN